MHTFTNDYSEGAHPSVIDALLRMNTVQSEGYGNDDVCCSARDKIRRHIGCPDAGVWFIPGGTQTNLIAAAAFLRAHESIICAATGHINGHETGAVEATGHKIIPVEPQNGKVTPAAIDAVLWEYVNCHLTSPRMVYISDATEVGTVYTKAELAALRSCCDAHDMYLYLDGARLGTALVSDGCDTTMADIAALTDAFYIGGTKNGALLGEALVVTDKSLSCGLDYVIKQRGALLAKGRTMGVQFDCLFSDDGAAWYECARTAVRTAQRIRAGLAAHGCEFVFHSPSNLLIAALSPTDAAAFADRYCLQDLGAAANGRRMIRIVTSWCTSDADADEIVAWYSRNIGVQM